MKQSEFQTKGMEFWYRLDKDRPDLTRANPEAGRQRGIDQYNVSDFPLMLGIALTVFERAHDRLPDLVALPKTADHFFAMKLFDPIPIKPNPASKLNAHLFLPEGCRDVVDSPKRFWVSNKPELPADDALAPGTYWLKLDLGNATQEKVSWPPTRDKRETLTEIARTWFAQYHNKSYQWGEWWYSASPQRLFIEEDLTDRLNDSRELRIYVRNGKAVFFLAVQRANVTGSGKNVIRYYDADLTPLEGGTLEAKVADVRLPEKIKQITEIAEHIGRNFNLIRVDLFDVKEGPAILGELSLCNWNARRQYHPDSFEDLMRKALFE